MVIAEAMTCGLPVISFDCPWGPRSIISNYEDGILVEKENTSKLAECMISLIQNKEKRILMSRTAVKNVQRFDIQHIAQKWKSLFEEI